MVYTSHRSHCSMDRRRIKRTLSAILMVCMIQTCFGLPLSIHSDKVDTDAENVNKPPKMEPPDVFSLIEASNKGNNMQLLEGDIVLDLDRSAMKCDGKTCMWSKNNNGIVNVPYTISPIFSDSYASVIRKAMQEFETLTCVRYVPRTTESNFVQIVQSGGCWSSVGKVGGVQQLSLSPECEGQGTVQHELNHALGFFHEQSRSDRDDYIDIITQNIRPGLAFNFLKFDTNNLGLPYDYYSVMHYGRYAFSTSNTLPTIVPKPNPSIPIGQRYGFSTLDIAKINKLYECGLCRELLTNTTGSITSSNYPNNYPSNSECVWLIRIPSDQIFLQFSAFDVHASKDCTSDYLRVYDGANKSAPLLLDRGCGSEPLPSMISTGKTMLLEFVSDNKMEATGFMASYSPVSCGFMLTSPTGIVASPFYPNNYPPSVDCSWMINAPAGLVVSLTMTDFNVEHSSVCRYDYLLVFDGPKTTSPLIGKFCGKVFPMAGIRSTTNSLLLQFHSEGSIQLPGFSAKYVFVPKN